MGVYNTGTLSSVDFVVRRALVIRSLVIYTVYYENSLTKLVHLVNVKSIF